MDKTWFKTGFRTLNALAYVLLYTVRPLWSVAVTVKCLMFVCSLFLKPNKTDIKGHKYQDYTNS